ncbi:MAG: acetolactate decarboxylase [Candidatus Omnitrophica bacterium]|nr:acetolactate decarboxylase [Candidatus Omnitrophota bacterium]
MRIKRIHWLIVSIIFFLFLFSIHSCQQKPKDTLYQVSTIDALLDGAYDGEISFGEIKKHGNFGIGTFDGIDGEMIALDGKFYQVKADGKVYRVSSGTKSPFADVCFFRPEQKIVIKKKLTFDELKQFLDKLLPTKNIFYAIKIKGNFDYVKARSVPKQKRPYPPLAEAAKDQVVFEFKDKVGIIVGFYSPNYIKGVGVPEYHMHFLQNNRKKGGHILDLIISHAVIEIDYLDKFYLVLPKNASFLNADLAKDRQTELQRVEK